MPWEHLESCIDMQRLAYQREVDHPLTIALEPMGAAGVETLPVVSRADVQRLVGIITLPEVLKAYGLEPTRRPQE
jgi:CBS domain-containing protein